MTIKRFLFLCLATISLTGCSISNSEYIEVKEDGLYYKDSKLLLDTWDGVSGAYKANDGVTEANYYYFEGRYIDFTHNQAEMRESDMDKYKDALCGDLYLDTQCDMIYTLKEKSKIVCQFTTYNKNTTPLDDLREDYYRTLSRLNKLNTRKVKVGNLILTIPKEEDSYFLLRNKKVVDINKKHGVVKVSSKDVKVTEDVTLPNGTILQKGSSAGKVFYLYNGFKIFTDNISNILEVK